MLQSKSPQDYDTETFEKQITYFYGVDNEEPVLEAYMKAIEKLNMLKTHTEESLAKEMLPHLEKAYQCVQQQRNWKFDTHAAAKLEFQIILGNVKGAPFEEVQELMVQLYTLVFQSKSPLILKAAMLRTFLYQYKAAIPNVSENDRRVMTELAEASKFFLNATKPV